MTDTLKRLCNLLLREGMTEEAFDQLRETVTEHLLLHNRVYRGSFFVSNVYKDEQDLINRTKKVHYPHGTRIEFRENGEYEGV